MLWLSVCSTVEHQALHSVRLVVFASAWGTFLGKPFVGINAMITSNISGRKLIAALALIILLLALVGSLTVSFMVRRADTDARLVKPISPKTMLGDRQLLGVQMTLPWNMTPKDLAPKITAPFAITNVQSTRSGFGAGTFCWHVDYEIAALKKGTYQSARLSLPLGVEKTVDLDLGTIDVFVPAILNASHIPKLASLPEDQISTKTAWVTPIVALAVCVFVIVIYWTRRTPVIEKPKPGDHVLTEFKRVIADDGIPAADINDRVSELIGQYVKEVWEIPITKATTRECLNSLKESVPAELEENFRHYLTLAERLKYSPHVDSGLAEDHLEAAKTLVAASEKALEAKTDE